ncbi:MAG: hypothetical protein FD152_481 [Xanthobacteraceae bacterium]|nr:MAG: hypothetical protein FD152_481 [Xanthobacteraceae bacterium]
MPILQFLRALALVLIAVAFLGAPAYAQTTVDGGSIFGVIKPYLTELIGLLVAAALTYALKLLKEKTGIDLEAKHRDTIQVAITNAAGLVIAKAGDHMAGLKIDVKSEALAKAVTYVLQAAPDAVSHFGLSPGALREKIEAKIGVLTAPQANV